jgi:hypothetical protein
MDRLDWVEGLDGWCSQRYRIELVAPVLWVLSRTRENGGDGKKIVRASVETTTGSLRAAKRAAEVLEARRLRRQRLARHLALLILAAIPVAAVTAFPGAWTIPVTGAVILLSIRSLVILVDSVIGRPYERVKETYQ